MADQQVTFSLQLRLPFLEKGVKNYPTETRRLQTMLNLWLDHAEKGGTPNPIHVDGSFGPETDKAVRGWQANNGLTVDGQVGQLTWSALIKAWLTQDGPG